MDFAHSMGQTSPRLRLNRRRTGVARQLTSLGIRSTSRFPSSSCSSLAFCFHVLFLAAIAVDFSAAQTTHLRVESRDGVSDISFPEKTGRLVDARLAASSPSIVLRRLDPAEAEEHATASAVSVTQNENPLFQEHNIVLAYAPAFYNLDPPDTTYVSEPLVLSFPTLDPDVRLVIEAHFTGRDSAPFNPTANANPHLLIDFQPMEGDVIAGADKDWEVVFMASRIHRDGTVLTQTNFTMFETVDGVLDMLWRAPGTQGHWMWADVFPYNGQDFVDVHSFLNNTVGVRLDRTTEPFSLYDPTAAPTSVFDEFKIDVNTTFIGLFQSWFGDQVKLKEHGVVGTYTTGNATGDVSQEEIKMLWPFSFLKIPGGTSAGLPPLNLTTLFTTGQITKLDKSHRQFRKGTPGEILVDNTGQIPIY